MIKKILFFTEALGTGGKERRMVELFHYLKKNTNYELQLIVTEEFIHYDIAELNIPVVILKRRFIKYDPSLFFTFFKIVKEFKPDIIHSWGGMTTLYSIPTSKHFKIPLINSQIADATPWKNRTLTQNILVFLNQFHSSILISNSYAGVKAYIPNSKKSIVIYNGIRLERFNGLRNRQKIKNEFKIKTPLSIIMVGDIGIRKHHELYIKIAKEICEINKDVSFVAVGHAVGHGISMFKLEDKVKNMNLDRFIFTGRISNVEELVNACDIGVLISNTDQHAEGIPNAVLEYMALSKPVIATDDGGTRELIAQNESGYLVNNDKGEIKALIIKLLKNPDLRKKMGKKGREIVEKKFTIDQMGKEFVKVYKNLF